VTVSPYNGLVISADGGVTSFGSKTRRTAVSLALLPLGSVAVPTSVYRPGVVGVNVVAPLASRVWATPLMVSAREETATLSEASTTSVTESPGSARLLL
jgi:hypothetical protein